MYKPIHDPMFVYLHHHIVFKTDIVFSDANIPNTKESKSLLILWGSFSPFELILLIRPVTGPHMREGKILDIEDFLHHSSSYEEWLQVYLLISSINGKDLNVTLNRTISFNDINCQIIWLFSS